MSTPLAPTTRGRVAARHHVTEHGRPDAPVVLLVHGFGADQRTWQRMLPALAADHRVVLLDLMGTGRSDPTAYDREKYATLDGHAADVAEVCQELDLRDVVVVAHSVSSAIVARASLLAPGRFRRLMMLAPSARYLDDPDAGYAGGFVREDVEELLESLDHNYVAWAAAVAPMIMGNPDRPELGAEMAGVIRQTNPETARDFCRATFFSDSREVFARVSVPTVVFQCRQDALAPDSAVREVVALLPDAVLVELRATGHCPHVSAAEETAAAVLANLPPGS